MKAPTRHSAERAGRSSKGFLFLILLGMFFVLFVLPQMKKRGQPAQGGPGGGIIDAPNPGGSIMPGPENSGGIQNGDWNLEVPGKSGAGASGIDMDNFGKGGTIQLPGQNPGGLPSGITIDGRTPGFNPNPGNSGNPGFDTTVDIPSTPDRTQKGDWSIEEVDTVKPSSGVTIEPIQRTKPGQKTTKGDWSIETK